MGASEDGNGVDPESIAREYYDRIDADDYERVFELFADDVTYHRPGQEPIQDIEEFRTFYLEDRPLDDGRHEVESVVVDGDTVAVRGRYVGRQDGDPVELGWADFHRFEDAEIVERHTYTDRDAV
jgi:ketosteroid isomerase-like protein